MEVPWTLRLVVVLYGFSHLFCAVHLICPEPCDCQQHQHILCTNRGLRALPKASAMPSPEDIVTYSLGGNFISNVSAFDLPRFSRLQRLDLQYNQIRHIHPKAFQKLSRLEELYLGNNLLPGLSPGALEPLHKLRVLNLNGNELSVLGRGCFSSLAGLVKLRLDGNALQNLQEALFLPLGNLLYLHLENNRLRGLGRDPFAGLGRLRLLNLSGNLQSALRHPATFRPLGALDTLVLSGNQLQQLGSRVFAALGRLTRLILSGNRLAQLADEAFEGLGALRELRLDGNLLTHLPGQLLEPVHNLEVLDLSRNLLSSVHPAALTGLPALRELRLQGNALSALPGQAFTGNPALHRLDLDGNRWTCDCRLRGLKHWMGAWHSQGRLLTVFVQCRHPASLQGKYLDYLEDTQLSDEACQPGSSTASPPPPASPDRNGRELAGTRSGALGVSLQPRKPSRRGGRRKQHQYLPSARTMTTSSTEHIQQRASTTTALPERHGAVPRARRPALRHSRRRPGAQLPAPSALTLLSGTTSHTTAVATALFGEHSLAHAAPDLPAAPMVSDPCDFNKHFLFNLTVAAVTGSTAVVRWGVREHSSPATGPVRFRLLYDRFGQQQPPQSRFPRFVYLPERSEAAATLRELRGDTPYMVCVESLLGGRACPVAPRDHCAGLVTAPEGPRPLDYQLLTLGLLAANALLVLLVLAAWGSRALRRGWARRKGPVPPAVRHMYSTRRPYRSVGTGVSGDFSGFQAHRPRAAMCTINEADLIEFPGPCERFMDGNLRREEVMQRFTD
ncbi:TLR4 interactor with leucine rich repeats [Ambystoma mexicanum]|uniref:TLR4 interactor with leucine rich repeats n=1 Tax=Ambystoma mexicanum TaxID=8296 RepID=UPI0037E80BCE